MMNVVARELRDHPAGCELAKFRVRERAPALRGRQPLEHREIQPAQGGVGVEGGGAVGVIVEDQPRVLIEWLRNVAVLAGGESRPRGQRELCLRQMNDDAPRAPLAGPSICRESTGSCEASRREPSADLSIPNQWRRGCWASGDFVIW